MAEESGNEIAHLNPENQNESQPTQSEVVITGGTYHGAHIGPKTTNKIVQAHDYRNAKITHIHYHHGETAASEEPPTSGSEAHKRKRLETFEIEEGCIQISDDIFMNSKKPLREGAQIFEGYQEHVCGSRLPIAIKRIVPCTDAHIKEVEHLVKLSSHPNIVRIIQSKEIDSHVRTLYIAMELCSSQNLHDYLDESRKKNIPLDFKKAMSFTKQLVDGMKFIHSNGVLHRDMKPENVLLSVDKQQVKISDFGLGKQLRHGRSITKVTCLGQGTDGYRAPETYNSDVISKQADVFSLGLTIFGIWSFGKHPFGDDIDLLNYNIKKNKGRDLSGLMISGTKKDELIDLIDKMLQHDPQLRSTMEEASQHPFFIDELSLATFMQVACIKVKKLQTDQHVCDHIDLVSDHIDPATDNIDPVTDHIDPVTDHTDLVSDHIHLVTEHIDPVTELVTDNIDPVTDLIDRVRDPVTDDIDPTSDHIDPVSDHIDPVSDHIDPVSVHIDPVTDHTDPVSVHIDPVTDLVDRVINPVTDNIDPASDHIDPASDHIDPVSDHIDHASDHIDPASDHIDPVSDRIDLVTTNPNSFGIKFPHFESIGLHLMGESWRNALGSEFEKDYFVKLSEFVATERASQTIYPPVTDVFSWTVHCNIRDVKVVILGQNPYHGPNQAHGLSFSVKRPVPPPPSLKNMFKELSNDIEGFQHPGHGDLTGWAKQGVLLLNTVLTAREHSANSHKNKGWEKFTDAVIKHISSLNSGVVFLLWGLCAQKKGAVIDRKRHHVLQCAHPSPLSAYRGFLGCKHFSRANQLLKAQGDQEIDWSAL